MQKNEFLVINLTKYAPQLYTEKYKPQLKEIQGLNKWSDTSC